MDIILTENAEYLLCELYSAYVASRKSGAPTETARFFGSSEKIQEDCIQDWPTHDIDDAAGELDRKGMLIAQFADNELNESYLADDGIAYMEQRFGNKLDKLLQRIATLRAILLG